ncbi:MAG: 16S rRNA (cytidine(1402)-2'-O)-methyltransferase [Gammaproteobacteria bacterium]
MSIEAGTLYVVATPIGNRGDFSDRARAVLGSVALVLAEDTRRTRPLLRDLGITTPLLALHEHNERDRSAAVVERLGRGEALALVSDAGTPLISDPGFVLVRAVRAAGYTVSPVPGPSAAIAALSVAGLPTDRFAFEGFLPPKAVARRRVLEALAYEPRTMVFFEAVHRVRETLADLAAVFGGARQACVARELTKIHETVRAGTLDDIAAWAATDADVVRGEVVLVVEGALETVSTHAIDARSLLIELARELPAAKAAQITAKVTGEPRKQLYQWLIDAQTRRP